MDEKLRIRQNSMLPFEDFTEGLTSETLPGFRSFVEDTLRAPGLIYDQQRDALAAAAMRTLPYPEVSAEARELIRREVLELIAEGGRPYYPRYSAPLYDRLLSQGSDFLDLTPAENLHQAAASLLVAYHYFPSDGLPVFIGRLDELLEPYLDTVSEDTAREVLRSFWLMVDRLFPSGFVHANLGPGDSRTARMLLDLDYELKTITNISLRYDPDQTPRDLALLAVRNQMDLSKPYFINHPLMVQDFGEDYVIASCYNGMKLGGGIHTLVRYNFLEMVKLSDGTASDVLQNVIPSTTALAVEVINSRIRSLVEDFRWYENSYWVREGLLDPDRFAAYLGVFGLAEAVNWLMEQKGRGEAVYGSDPEANETAALLTARVGEELEKHPAVYSAGWHDRVLYHAQVGISSDLGLTPGTRIPGGQEPPLYEHLLCEAPHHACIPGGVSTILEFDQTARENLDAVLDIAGGAMQTGIRTLSVGSRDSEFIRVTGYLVRRSDLEGYREERANRYSTAVYGASFFETKPNHLHRRVQKV